MNILLDTHILLWYVNSDDKLPKRILEKILMADKVAISTISCFEVAWLNEHGKIDLPNNMGYMKWFENVVDETDIHFFDINWRIACQSVALPRHHKDPHDRLIIATALYYGFHLASLDGKFQYYAELDGKLVK